MLLLTNGDNKPNSFHLLKVLEDLYILWVVSCLCVLVARVKRMFILRIWEVDDELP